MEMWDIKSFFDVSRIEIIIQNKSSCLIIKLQLDIDIIWRQDFA